MPPYKVWMVVEDLGEEKDVDWFVYPVTCQEHDEVMDALIEIKGVLAMTGNFIYLYAVEEDIEALEKEK